jgi:hypothetical protein
VQLQVAALLVRSELKSGCSRTNYCFLTFSGKKVILYNYYLDLDSDGFIGALIDKFDFEWFTEI